VRGVPQEGPGCTGGRQAHAGPLDGRGRQGAHQVFIVAEHVEFKPQLKFGDGSESEEKPGEAAVDEQVEEEAEAKEASNF
jgi:hypothetical protein